MDKDGKVKRIERNCGCRYSENWDNSIVVRHWCSDECTCELCQPWLYEWDIIAEWPEVPPSRKAVLRATSMATAIA